MTINTCAPICFYFTQIDVAEKFDIPALLTSGDGPAPDYSKLALTDHAKAGEWRVQVAELVAKANRKKPPYVPPPEPTPDLPAEVVDANPPGSL